MIRKKFFSFILPLFLLVCVMAAALIYPAVRTLQQQSKRKGTTDFYRSNAYPVNDFPLSQYASGAFEDRIDINTADAKQLMTLPGIGENKANAIIRYREDVSLFYYKEDLLFVSGIGQGILDKISDMICCSVADAALP